MPGPDDKKQNLPPPSPAQRAAMAARYSNSLAPPPSSALDQERSIEIDFGEGVLASRRNPLSESGRFVGKNPQAETTKPALEAPQPAQQDIQPTKKKEPAILQSQARDLSPSTARLIARRRAMMEGQDQAGVFKLPRPGSDT